MTDKTQAKEPSARWRTEARWQTEAGLPAMTVRVRGRLVAYVAVPFTHKLASSRVKEAAIYVDVDEARRTPPGEAESSDADRAWWFGIRGERGATLDSCRADAETLARILRVID